MKKSVLITVLVLFIVGKLTAEVRIEPNNPNIMYRGVVEYVDVPSGGRELYRMRQSYIEANYGGYSPKVARNSSGITVAIKTSSPTVTFHLIEREDAGSLYGVHKIIVSV